MKKPTTATPEIWYTWKELVTPEGEDTPRLLTPWADPMVYEYEFDYIFPTEEDARKAKAEQAPEEDWILVKETLEPLYALCSDEDLDDGDSD
jgi:hypothetical protein